MTTTQNLHLPQWEADDRIMHDDFNDAFQKLDAAVKANSSALAAKADAAALAQKADSASVTALSAQIAACGNCSIVSGTYTGNGRSGAGNPITLTFDKKPMLVVIQDRDYGVSHTDAPCLILQYGMVTAYARHCTTSSYDETVTWTSRSVSWYGDTEYEQLNRNGSVYIYTALVVAE